jgi:hypothetical protein
MAGVNNADSCEAIAESSTIGLAVFLAWSRLVFRLALIFIDLHNRSIICQFYRSIVPTRCNYHRGQNAWRLRCECYRSSANVIDRPPAIIDRPRLLSIARDYYRSPATVYRSPATPDRANHLLIMIITLGWESPPLADSPTLPLCLIIIIN